MNRAVTHLRQCTFCLLIILQGCASSMVNRPREPKESKMDLEPESLVTYLRCPPSFKGDLVDFIQENLVYPESAKKDTIEGRVIVRFLIDSLGGTSEHCVVRGVRSDLDNEALRITRLLKFEWECPVSGTLKVPYIVPVDFRIKKKNA